MLKSRYSMTVSKHTRCNCFSIMSFDMFLFLHENYVMGTQCLSEALLMSTHSLCFCGEIRKIFIWIFLFGGHSSAFSEGEVLRRFQDFREKFWSKFWISLYILYIFTSPSARDREKSASLGRLFLPNRPLG